MAQMVLDKTPDLPYHRLVPSPHLDDLAQLDDHRAALRRQRCLFWRFTSLTLTGMLMTLIWLWGNAAEARDFNWCQCAYLDHAGQRMAERADTLSQANEILGHYVDLLQHEPRFHHKAAPLTLDLVYRP